MGHEGSSSSLCLVLLVTVVILTSRRRKCTSELPLRHPVSGRSLSLPREAMSTGPRSTSKVQYLPTYLTDRQWE